MGDSSSVFCLSYSEEVFLIEVELWTEEADFVYLLCAWALLSEILFPTFFLS